jgi:hypothetical protein
MPDLRVQAIASKAIEGAKIRYPDYPPGSGASWPDVYVAQREAELFAHAALEAIERAGFKIVPKAAASAPAAGR